MICLCSVLRSVSLSPSHSLARAVLFFSPLFSRRFLSFSRFFCRASVPLNKSQRTSLNSSLSISMLAIVTLRFFWCDADDMHRRFSNKIENSKKNSTPFVASISGESHADLWIPVLVNCKKKMRALALVCLEFLNKYSKKKLANMTCFLDVWKHGRGLGWRKILTRLRSSLLGALVDEESVFSSPNPINNHALHVYWLPTRALMINNPTFSQENLSRHQDTLFTNLSSMAFRLKIFISNIVTWTNHDDHFDGEGERTVSKRS